MDLREAWVRAVRTFLQGLLAVVGVAIYEAVSASIAAHGFDVQKVVAAAGLAALTAAVTYVYNLVFPAKKTDQGSTTG